MALVFAVAPAMADGPEKSFELSLTDRFQMVADLGRDTEVTAAGGYKKKTSTPGDVYFKHSSFVAGLEGSYGILTVGFAVAYNGDNNSLLELDTAEANLAFMDEVQLAMGYVATRHKGSSGSARLGTQKFLIGSGLPNMGIKLHGKVANGLFQYALSVFHGKQDFNGKTVSGVEAPGVALQLRFNLLGGETTGNREYFLGKKSAMTLGFTVAHQVLPDRHKFFKFKGKKADQKHLLHFDVFLTGDVALGDNSLPFLLIYEHAGMNPLAAKKVWSISATDNSGQPTTPSIAEASLTSAAKVAHSAPIGKFTYGLGFYVGSLKIMPAFKHSINIFTVDKDVVKGGLAHELELSLGYFPFGDNLNLKMGYVYKGGSTELKLGDLKGSYNDHKLITQVQMKL